MEKKTSITLIAALAIIAILAFALPSSAQTAPGSMSGASDLASMTMPKAVVMALTSGGAPGGNATFTVPYSAKVFKVGDVEYGSVSTTSAPVTGSLNTAAGMGVLSTAEALPATTTTDYLNKSSIPVAGTNAVIVLQDLNMTGAGNGKFSFEFGKLSVYLPDGTLSTFALNKPIKMDYATGQTRFTLEADPAVASTIAGTLGSGVTFPADAKPVPLSKILSST
jgi:hypothetical protein